MSTSTPSLNRKVAIVGLLFIALWTLAFGLGQVIPSLFPNSDIVIAWPLYFYTLVIFIVFTISVIALLELAKIVDENL